MTASSQRDAEGDGVDAGGGAASTRVETGAPTNAFDRPLPADGRVYADDIGDGSAAEDADRRVIDGRPARTSVVVATLAALGSLSLLGLGLAVPVHLLGPVVAAVGATMGRRRLVDVGVALLFATIALAGLASPIAPATLALATVLAVLSWDAGRYGITVGEQLGRGAPTVRAELFHVSVTAAVGLAGVAVGYGTYLFVEADGSVVGALLLVGGLLALLTQLR